MDYTLSNSYDTDAGTGQRMHEDQKAIPTVWSGPDANSIIWSLMEILKAAGLAGIQFNKANPASYRLLLKAIRSAALITGVDTGVANAMVANFTPPIDALTDSMCLWIKAAAANTSATTLTVDATGTKPVFGLGHNALQGGEIVAGGRCRFVWHAALGAWILAECTGAALQIGPATKSGHALQLGQATGRWIGRQLIIATAAYVPTAGATTTDALINGGGGGGGGGQATSSGQTSAGAGGGGGGWARKRMSTASVSGSTITIGAAGAAGAIGGGAGQAGGTTSFGAVFSATGGGGGSAGLAGSNSQVSLVGFGVPGLGSGGDINGSGGVGQYAVYGPSSTSGAGGGSFLGGGATWVSGTSGGNAATVRGAGGSGGVCAQSVGTGAQGGVGGQGYALIDEFS